MRRIIARIVALLVCVFAAVVIYHIASKAYFYESIKDFATQGERFAQNQLVEPKEVQSTTTNGKFVHAIAVYWRNFQNLNNEMDSETNKALTVFNEKNLSTPHLVSANLIKLHDYKEFMQKNSNAIEKNAIDLITEISALDQEELQIGNIQRAKVEIAKTKKLREDIANNRRAMADYIYSALEFLQHHQQTISFAQNGSINFGSQADQQYFYGLMNAVVELDKNLKDMLVKNRDSLRGDITAMKAAYEKAH